MSKKPYIHVDAFLVILMLILCFFSVERHWISNDAAWISVTILASAVILRKEN